MSDNNNTFWLRFLTAILLVIVLVVGGVAVFGAGYAQGYAAKVAAANPSSQAIAPFAPYHWAMPYYGFHPFFGIFGFLLFAFIFLAILRALFRPFWWGPMGRHWMHGHHGYYPEGMAPPWMKEHQGEAEKKQE